MRVVARAAAASALALVLAARLGAAPGEDAGPLRSIWDSLDPETRDAFARIHVLCEAPPKGGAPAPPPADPGFVQFQNACQNAQAALGPFAWTTESGDRRRIWLAECPDERMAPALAAKEWAMLEGPRNRRRFDLVALREKEGTTSFVRVLGLPGEPVDFIHGDLYVKGHLVRKPEALQRQLWKEIDRLPAGKPAWVWPTGVAPAPDGSIRFAAEKGKVEIRRQDAGRLRDEPEPVVCSDLRLEATVRLEAGDGVAILEITDGPFIGRAEIGRDTFALRLLEREEEMDLAEERRVEKGALQGAPGSGVRLALENVDDALTLECDGRRLARIEFDSETEGGRSAVRIGAERAVAIVRDVVLRRDMYWRRGDRHDYPVTVREGRLFVAYDSFDAAGDSRFVAASTGIAEDAVLGVAFVAFDAARRPRRIY